MEFFHHVELKVSPFQARETIVISIICTDMFVSHSMYYSHKSKEKKNENENKTTIKIKKTTLRSYFVPFHSSA